MRLLNLDGLASYLKAMRRGEVSVQAHVLVLRCDLEQREDDQDEDEVNLLIRIPN